MSLCGQAALSRSVVSIYVDFWPSFCSSMICTLSSFVHYIWLCVANAVGSVIVLFLGCLLTVVTVLNYWPGGTHPASVIITKPVFWICRSLIVIPIHTRDWCFMHVSLLTLVNIYSWVTESMSFLTWRICGHSPGATAGFHSAYHSVVCGIVCSCALICLWWVVLFIVHSSPVS